MILIHPYARPSLSRRFGGPHSSPSTRASVKSLPISPEKARFYKQAEAAVDVVERACRLCVDVKRTLVSNDDPILEKNDQTLVTIADVSVQALTSLGLGSCCCAKCVKEAGGQVTDWSGSPLDLAADQMERRIIFPSGGVLVSNGNLHRQLVEMISANSSVA